MQETDPTTIQRLIDRQQIYFQEGKSQPIEKRIPILKSLKASIQKHEQNILEALKADLGKSHEEGYITEVGLVYKEINYHIKHIKSWSKLRKVKTPLVLLPSSSYLKFEPLGNILVVAPWNYPFQLLFNPLIGAISAGNTAILKPSEFAINTNQVMQQIIEDVFDPQHAAMVQGGKETNQILFKQKFDLIFFTGSTQLGKIVMQAAANNLTPVILELGGKSPCMVDKTANVEIAAKRIAWGKMVNLGQTCIAPDYLLVHEKIKDELVEGIIKHWKNIYGEEPQKSDLLPRMITQEALDRVSGYLKNGKVIYGGNVDRADKYISPTIIENVALDSDIMNGEIFGPVLPIITYQQEEEAFDLIRSKPKPLASYYFGKKGKMSDFLNKHTSGGTTINDLLIHISNSHLPFGGIGSSGTGRYHGKHSFEAFSNPRSIMKSPTWIDLPFRYPPFKQFSIIKKLLS